MTPNDVKKKQMKKKKLLQNDVKKRMTPQNDVKKTQMMSKKKKLPQNDVKNNDPQNDVKTKMSSKWCQNQQKPFHPLLVLFWFFFLNWLFCDKYSNAPRQQNIVNLKLWWFGNYCQ